VRELRVHIPQREYSIFIGAGILKASGALLRQCSNAAKAAVITDENVLPLYAAVVEDSLRHNGFAPATVVVPAGELSKSADVLLRVYDGLLAMELTRSDLIVALGGGVVGDLAGYAAATYLRGVPFAQMPTTLLAQVDSSVGGKVAVNLPHGKNLIGAFYQPKMVITDTGTLDTLPPRVFADGMGEIIKHGAIADASLFAVLESGHWDREEIIYANCDIKRRVVEADEYDTGGRMVLNFGHTFGHVIETADGFARYTHGEAVAIGMVMAAEFGERLGVTAAGTAARLKHVLTRYQLPIETDMACDLRTMLLDKKRSGGKLHLVLLRDIGKAAIHPFAVAELEKLL